MNESAPLRSPASTWDLPYSFARHFAGKRLCFSTRYLLLSACECLTPALAAAAPHCPRGWTRDALRLKRWINAVPKNTNQIASVPSASPSRLPLFRLCCFFSLWRAKQESTMAEDNGDWWKESCEGQASSRQRRALIASTNLPCKTTLIKDSKWSRGYEVLGWASQRDDAVWENDWRAVWRRGATNTHTHTKISFHSVFPFVLFS